MMLNSKTFNVDGKFCNQESMERQQRQQRPAFDVSDIIDIVKTKNAVNNSEYMLLTRQGMYFISIIVRN